jgi:hypothetical protein
MLVVSSSFLQTIKDVELYSWPRPDVQQVNGTRQELFTGRLVVLLWPAGYLDPVKQFQIVKSELKHNFGLPRRRTAKAMYLQEIN